jgi:uncharacterized protein (TIGR03083 family)
MPESISMPRTKVELLQHIQQARAGLEQTISQLTAGQMTASDPNGGWSVKDHLAHLATWENGLAALLEGRPRYAGMGFDEATYMHTDLDGLNAIIHERHKDRPLSEVLTDFRRAHEQILAALARLSDTDLFKTYSHYQPDQPGKDSGDPILKWIVGNTYEHYALHHRRITSLAESNRG